MFSEITKSIVARAFIIIIIIQTNKYNLQITGFLFKLIFVGNNVQKKCSFSCLGAKRTLRTLIRNETQCYHMEKKCGIVSPNWLFSLNLLKVHLRYFRPDCPYTIFTIFIYSIHTTSTTCLSILGEKSFSREDVSRAWCNAFDVALDCNILWGQA